MNERAISERLAALGRSDMKHLAKLEANRAERCELLRQAAQLACDAGHLDGEVTANVIEPKPPSR